MRELEKQRQTGKFTYGGIADDLSSAEQSSLATELDTLWEKLRNFFDDIELDGTKITLKRGMKPSRLRFMEYCEQKSQLNKRQANVLDFQTVIEGFKVCFMKDDISPAQFKKLFRALEVFYDESTMKVDWNKLLEANTTREITSVRGIFPKIKPKPPSAAQLEKKRKEEQEEREKEEKILKEQEARKGQYEKDLLKNRRVADSKKVGANN